MLSKKYKALLLSSTAETPDTRTFVFVLDQELSYVPGQYVFLSDNNGERRPFSILDYNHRSKQLSLGIRKNGSFTKQLWQATPGTSMTIMGPYGRFAATTDKAVFVAGGIGITPIYNMLRHRTGGSDRLHYSAKSEEEMAYLEELLAIEGLQTSLYFTRRPSPRGDHRRLAAADILESLEDHDQYEFLICGPSKMIDDLRGELLTAGIPRAQIRSEVF